MKDRQQLFPGLHAGTTLRATDSQVSLELFSSPVVLVYLEESLDGIKVINNSDIILLGIHDFLPPAHSDEKPHIYLRKLWQQ